KSVRVVHPGANLTHDQVEAGGRGIARVVLILRRRLLIDVVRAAVCRLARVRSMMALKVPKHLDVKRGRVDGADLWHAHFKRKNREDLPWLHLHVVHVFPHHPREVTIRVNSPVSVTVTRGFSRNFFDPQHTNGANLPLTPTRPRPPQWHID